MVIYDLICNNHHAFEGWFANAHDFAQQQQSLLLTCPVCDSSQVERKLSVPKVAAKRSAESKEVEQPNAPVSKKEKRRQYAEFQAALRKVHDYIEQNYEDVGSKFAEQALGMHSGEIEPRNIRGRATAKQAKELKDKGVSAVVLPEKPVDKDKLN